ncbi:MAG: PepSY domain-containing protein [bacterium]
MDNRYIINPLRHLPVLAGVLLLFTMLTLPVYAAEPRDGLSSVEQPRNGLSSGQSFAPAPGISIDKATSLARQQVGGRVLSATPKQRGGHTVYRVRMLIDGERVITVTVDHQGRVKGGR